MVLLLAYIFIIAILTVGCTKHQEFSSPPEERAWMEKFFHDLLFCEGGVFTLWGHKPVTEIALYHFTEEEMEEMIGNLKQQDLENFIVQDQYDLPENWAKWEAVCEKYPFYKYLLFRSHYSEDKKASFIYFVDILQTAAILEENYEIFRRNVGIDFHPLDVVLQMPDSKSEFWIKVRGSENSSLLWGLLFGYGKINSMAFNWKYSQCSPRTEKFFSKVHSSSSTPPLEGQIRISKTNFEIPGFISFQGDDKEMMHY